VLVFAFIRKLWMGKSEHGGVTGGRAGTTEAAPAMRSTARRSDVHHSPPPTKKNTFAHHLILLPEKTELDFAR
jgi:hypothetical protein